MTRDTPAPRIPRGPLAGARVEVEVLAVAHGGHCVARVGDDPAGRVVFVRHALPGERVRVHITEDRGGSFCRGDAVEILRAAPGRVTPPCPHAGPGRCGGCDWQHVAGAEQRALKAQVVAEQLRRLAGVDVAPTVEELPGGLLGWRSRTVYASGRAGRLGLRRHRSHDVEVLAGCPLGVPGVGDADVLDRRWPGVSGVEVVGGEAAAAGVGAAADSDADPQRSVLVHRPGGGRHPRGRRPPDRVELVEGPARLTHHVGGRRFEVSAGGFWQVHPAAAEVLTSALLAALDPRPGERVLELFAGAGVLSALIAQRVGVTGTLIGLESSAAAVADAAGNLADLPWAEVRRARVTPDTVAGAGSGADLVVLDPPRAGAGTAVMTAILALGPRAVGYVACDPAALARDLRVGLDLGWRLGAVRAFDAFPMTHHVECVATLLPPDGRDAGDAGA